METFEYKFERLLTSVEAEQVYYILYRSLMNIYRRLDTRVRRPGDQLLTTKILIYSFSMHPFLPSFLSSPTTAFSFHLPSPPPPQKKKNHRTHRTPLSNIVYTYCTLFRSYASSTHIMIQ